MQVEERLRRHRERHEEREHHGQHRGDEEAAPNRSDEAADIKLIEADQKPEEEEYPDAQDNLNLGSRLHQSRDGAEHNATGGVGDD